MKDRTWHHPSDDRLHYMLALAHALSQDVTTAANHLAKAIALNPDNRIQAREESDFDGIRQTRAFIDALTTQYRPCWRASHALPTPIVYTEACALPRSGPCCRPGFADAIQPAESAS